MEWNRHPQNQKEERGATFDGTDEGAQGGSREQEAEPASKLRDLRPEKDPMGARNKRGSQEGA